MGKKILLADDSITIQKVIELTFSDEDFDVVTVGNGRLALEKLSEVQPDIVLCDIIMPEKDGYEVCEHVKTSEALSHIPVLLLTGAFEPFDQERAERVGSDGFLAKPFEPETLIAKVKDLLSRAPAPRGERPGVTDLGVTAPQQAIAPAPPKAAPPLPGRVSPELEEVPPAVPPMARETAPPVGVSLIPEEPFEAFDAGEESPAAHLALERDEPLAPVSEDELATLAGESEAEPVPGDSSADSASTVMFTAGQLPWDDEPARGVEAPPEPEASERADEMPPEPVLTPERPVASDLAEQTGAAFEEVLEEDLDFGTPGLGEAATGSDTQAPMAADVLPDQPEESSTFETVAPPPPAELEPEPPPVFEAEAPAPEEPELELEPAEAPPEPEAPSAYEASGPSEWEAPPAYEPPAAPEREAPPERETLSAYEPSAPPEWETPAAYEPPAAPEREGPPVYERFAPPEPEAPPEYEVPEYEVAPEDEALAPEPEAPPAFEAAPSPEYEASAVPSRPETTLPPLEPAPAQKTESAPTALFEEPEPEVTPELAPPQRFAEAPPLPTEAVEAPEPDAEAPPEPDEPIVAEVVPGTGREAVVESFADIETGGETEEPPLPPSEAASVPVPVDMVEKIAQRVVAQVSDKVVREIAWEVIPDLAEALIKQEIERLKNELQKL